jgi:hypothetical protein
VDLIDDGRIDLGSDEERRIATAVGHCRGKLKHP